MSFNRKSPGGQENTGPTVGRAMCKHREARKPGNNENFNSRPRQPQ